MVITVTNPRQLLGQWRKASPFADVVHCILRYDGLLLLTYCGRTIPLKDAARLVNGARRCEVCESRRRIHLKERNAHVSTRQ